MTSKPERKPSPAREKVAVSTIRYELEPAPHRMLDSDADIRELSHPGKSSIDTGFGGLAPRIIVTENNTAKNTIVPRHAQPPNNKEERLEKIIRENEALKQENTKLKHQKNPEAQKQPSRDKIVSSPAIVMTPSLGRNVPPKVRASFPEPIHDSSRNVLDLRRPGMDSFKEE